MNRIRPANGVNTGDITITDLGGSDFQSYDYNGQHHHMLIRLRWNGYRNIDATNLTVISSSQITCEFNLTGQAPGYWDVHIINPNSWKADLPNGFLITEPLPVPAPSVASITPATGRDTGSVDLATFGSGFNTTVALGTTVKLTRAGNCPELDHCKSSVVKYQEWLPGLPSSVGHTDNLTLTQQYVFFPYRMDPRDKPSIL
ncbi:MAG: hypothetical protein WCF90_05955 [Methanomicrobiales archaeon]